MKAFDARCGACGRVHIIWVMWREEPGDTVTYAHLDGSTACGAYAEHELLRELSGLSTHAKWGPPA